MDVAIPDLADFPPQLPAQLDRGRATLLLHAFERAEFGIAVFDARLHCIEFVNAAFAGARGYLPAEMVGLSVDVLYPEDLVEERRAARAAIDAANRVAFETEQVTRNGRRFPVRLDCAVLRDARGDPEHVIVFACDITARRQAQRELQLAAAAFEVAQPLMVLDARRRIQRVNGAFTALTGYAAEESVGRDFPLLDSQQSAAAYPESFWEQLDTAGFWQGEQWIQTRDGDVRIVRRTFSAVRGPDGAIAHYVAGLHDQTRERNALVDLDRATFSDALTGLPNRAFLRVQLQQLLDGGGERRCVLVAVDVDHFKRINALHGHAVGDALLRQVARRLQQQPDCGALSRIGGDTFAYLGCPVPGDATSPPRSGRVAADRIRAALGEPFELENGVRVGITASVGCAELTAGTDADTALEAVELALQEAKAPSCQHLCVYTPQLQERHREREQLAHELAAAIGGDGLELHPQLQVDRNGRAVGAELLLRWTRANGEQVLPEVLIPLAEQDRLMAPLDTWVLEHACRLLADWGAKPALAELTVAVNVSPGQFQQPDFVGNLREWLVRSGAAPTRLLLEITESAALDDLAGTAQKLSQLRALGVKVALDDFGIGYSSMTYLAQLPLDQLKIDQSFVAQVPFHPVNTVLVESMITMAHGLGLEVVAEGVETTAQQTFLQAHGCEVFQGYLYARPMTLAAFEARVAQAARVGTTAGPGCGAG